MRTPSKPNGPMDKVGEFLKEESGAKPLSKTGKPKPNSGWRLGFDRDEVPIVNGVATVKIGYAHYLIPEDIHAMKQLFQARGAKTVIVNSGSVENDKLAMS